MIPNKVTVDSRWLHEVSNTLINVMSMMAMYNLEAKPDRDIWELCRQHCLKINEMTGMPWPERVEYFSGNTAASKVWLKDYLGV